MDQTAQDSAVQTQKAGTGRFPSSVFRLLKQLLVDDRTLLCYPMTAHSQWPLITLSFQDCPDAALGLSPLSMCFTDSVELSSLCRSSAVAQPRACVYRGVYPSSCYTLSFSTCTMQKQIYWLADPPEELVPNLPLPFHWF